MRARLVGSVRWRQEARLKAALASRLIMTLRDQPGDLAHRKCKHCGAPVIGYALRPNQAEGYGGEIICCTRGHRLHEGEWDVACA